MYTEEDIQEAKEILRESGYYVGNLWSVPDIIDNFETEDGQEVDDVTAYEILDDALQNQWNIEQIWSTIDEIAAYQYDLKRKEDE